MKTKKQKVSLEAAEILNEIIKKGYEEARRRVPLFTDMLFAKVHENNQDEAFSQFLAAFIDKAVTTTVAQINDKIIKAVNDGKDTKK